MKNSKAKLNTSAIKAEVFFRSLKDNGQWRQLHLKGKKHNFVLKNPDALWYNDNNSKYHKEGCIIMNYVEYRDAVMASKPNEWIAQRRLGTWVLKNDLMISIETEKRSLMELDKNDFLAPYREEWATKFSDPRAYMQRYWLKYGVNVLDIICMIALDGGRVIVPLPKMGTMFITPWQDKVGQIISYSLREYIEYRDKAGITISK